MSARLGLLAAMVALAALLQTTVFQYLALGGYRPDLLLLLTVLLALREGPEVGLRVGFSTGLLADLLMTQSAVGTSALIFLGCGYLVGLLRPNVARSSATAPLVIAFVSAVAATAGFGLLTRLIGGERFTPSLVARTALMVGIYNLLLAPLAIRVVDGLVDRVGLESEHVTA